MSIDITLGLPSMSSQACSSVSTVNGSNSSLKTTSHTTGSSEPESIAALAAQKIPAISLHGDHRSLSSKGPMRRA